LPTFSLYIPQIRHTCGISRTGRITRRRSPNRSGPCYTAVTPQSPQDFIERVISLHWSFHA
jgi:hypothetical protein